MDTVSYRWNRTGGSDRQGQHYQGHGLDTTAPLTLLVGVRSRPTSWNLLRSSKRRNHSQYNRCFEGSKYQNKTESLWGHILYDQWPNLLPNLLSSTNVTRSSFPSLYPPLFPGTLPYSLSFLTYKTSISGTMFDDTGFPWTLYTEGGVYSCVICHVFTLYDRPRTHIHTRVVPSIM